MNRSFFQYESYREFLKDRYLYLKSVRPNFSSRNLAKKAGVSSPSYFKMVISNERKLSLEYAEKFAEGLGLSQVERECLLTSVEYENASDAKIKVKFLAKLKKLERETQPTGEMTISQMDILGDIINLKLYLLAQSKKFKLNFSWICEQFGNVLDHTELEKRIDLLFTSGLWEKDGEKIKTIAPTITTGHKPLNASLMETHNHLLDEAKRALNERLPSERLVSGRTFLCDPKSLPAIQEKIDKFKKELEAEFEDLGSTKVYQLHFNFFELSPKE